MQEVLFRVPDPEEVRIQLSLELPQLERALHELERAQRYGNETLQIEFQPIHRG